MERAPAKDLLWERGKSVLAGGTANRNEHENAPAARLCAKKTRHRILWWGRKIIILSGKGAVVYKGQNNRGQTQCGKQKGKLQAKRKKSPSKKRMSGAEKPRGKTSIFCKPTKIFQKKSKTLGG